MKHRLPKLNNRGAGLVSVLIAILLLAAMGTLLMVLAYTSVEMKASERRGKEAFYDAESVVEQMEAGLQLVVSDSIIKAYSDALVDYSLQSNGVSAVFSSAYISAITGWKNSEGSVLFNGDSTYNTSVLAAMVSGLPTGSSLSVTGRCPSDSSKGLLSVSSEKVCLKDITVSYTSPKGRVSTIETDFELSIPDINYALSQYTVSGIPEFAVIARNTMTQNTAGLESTLIKGNAYAGAMDIRGTGLLKIEDGTVICKSSLDVRGTSGNPTDPSRFLVADTAGIWADTISIHTGSKISLLGKSYLANDLNLAGTGAAAKLEGSYFGFGNSLTKSAQSSSIIANGMNTTLDISNLDRLILAGYSFIGDSAEAENVMMGESLSVRPNQSAYLVPVEYLKDSDGKQPPTNPNIVSEGSPELSLDMTKELWNGKTLASYGVELKKSSQTYGGQTIIYYFMKFDTPQHASEYFRDYYSANANNIQDNIERYISVTNTSASLQTKGYTFTNEDDRVRFNRYLDNGSAGILDGSAARLQTMFANLCKTLSTSDDAGAATNPFEYVVNTTKLSALSAPVKFMDTNGNVVAMAVPGGYNYTAAEKAANPGLCLIIAGGDVSISTEFEGLLISGGNMNLNASTILADRDAVVAAYTALAEDGVSTIRGYLNITIEDEYAEGSGAASTGWNVPGLVSTANWQKK